MTDASEDDAMADSRDRIEIDGLQQTGAAPRRAATPSGSRFIMVWFKCCQRYGRLSRNAAKTRYEGRCPRCGGRVSAGIGTDGTNRRMFEAR
ncbi:MAG: hypothetical protein CMJ54_12110 [Planctomycetaceae bacterium]|nr:hypothetical protein [Planctomycetaceae bacterium]